MIAHLRAAKKGNYISVNATILRQHYLLDVCRYPLTFIIPHECYKAYHGDEFSRVRFDLYRNSVK